MSKKKISIPVFLLVCVLLVIITFQVTFLGVTMMYREKISNNATDQTEEVWEAKLDYINELTEKYFLKEISLEALAEVLPAAYVASLNDKYTYYMPKEQFEDFSSNNQGDMQGIGVNVIYNSEYNAIEVVGVMSGSPALENGVEAGDLIYSVEGQSVAELGYNVAIDVMLGEAGSVATFSVMRKKDDGTFEKLEFAIKRGFIVQETVTHKLYNGNVGVVRIEEFDLKTPAQFKNAIEKLSEQGADRFVFDLRYNPGGDFESITEILDFLLPEGPIIRTEDRFGQGSVIESDAEDCDFPMAVVVNGSTASAAELFTAALKDYKKAVIVGETTYGKGTMQSVFSLPDGSAVSMTTDRYFPPFSDSYDGIGVEPDREVFLDEEFKNTSIYKLTYEQDIQLKTAIEAVAD